MQDLQELRAYTPTEHVDYNILQDVIDELEIMQKVSELQGNPVGLTQVSSQALCSARRWTLGPQNSVTDTIHRKTRIQRLGDVHQQRVQRTI